MSNGFLTIQKTVSRLRCSVVSIPSFKRLSTVVCLGAIHFPSGTPSRAASMLVLAAPGTPVKSTPGGSINIVIRPSAFSSNFLFLFSRSLPSSDRAWLVKARLSWARFVFRVIQPPDAQIKSYLAQGGADLSAKSSTGHRAVARGNGQSTSAAFGTFTRQR